MQHVLLIAAEIFCDFFNQSFVLFDDDVLDQIETYIRVHFPFEDGMIIFMLSRSSLNSVFNFSMRSKIGLFPIVIAISTRSFISFLISSLSLLSSSMKKHRSSVLNVFIYHHHFIMRMHGRM